MHRGDEHRGGGYLVIVRHGWDYPHEARRIVSNPVQPIGDNPLRACKQAFSGGLL